MRRFYIGVLAIFMLCGFVLAGCSKADSASLADCHALYENIITKYGETSEDSHIIFKNNKIDLYSETCYDAEIYQAIESEKTGFALLKQGKQYELLLKSGTAFYDNYDTFIIGLTQTYEKKVGQNLKTKLYKGFEAMEKACEETKKAKLVFETVCQDNVDATSINVKTNLNYYLKSYVNLINKAIEVNELYEEIYTKHMVVANSNEIVSGDYQRIVFSAQLYIAKYLSLWLFEANEDLVVDHSAKTVFSCLSQIIENQERAGSADTEDNHTKYVYNIALQKIETFKQEVENYEVALNKITDDSTNPYNQFVDSFENKVINFENFFLTNVLNV